MPDASTSPVPEQRVADAVTAAAQRASQRHPHLAGLLRDELDGLVRRLQDAVGGGGSDAERWQAYVVQLDRGLDELQVELDRAVERSPAPEQVRPVLALRCRALELLAWRWHARGSDGRAGSGEPEVLVDAERELRRCEADGRPREELDRALRQVRSELGAG